MFFENFASFDWRAVTVSKPLKVPTCMITLNLNENTNKIFKSLHLVFCLGQKLIFSHEIHPHTPSK